MFDSRLPHRAELALWREHLLDRQDQAGSIPALRTPSSRPRGEMAYAAVSEAVPSGVRVRLPPWTLGSP